MKNSYRDRDYEFGQAILALRTKIDFTQARLANYLGVSRRAVVDWEAGNSYPKAEHLKSLIGLAVKERTFPAGQEAEEIRALWNRAHQKVWLDELWLQELLTPQASNAHHGIESSPKQMMDDFYRRDLLIEPTPLIGRDSELVEIARILTNPACRLLTILGPGGVGKTRLVLEFAAGQMDSYNDGVAFVPLASVSLLDQVVSAIGDALDLSFVGQADPTKYLLHYLRNRHMLLVLDNFEHLIESALLVQSILQHAPHITILVTSRTRLQLKAEWLFEVEGLSYPHSVEPGSSQALTNLSNYGAVQLFAQRVAQVQPSLSITESTLNTIVHICQHVAGIPLALELVAAGVRTHSIDEIEQEIQVNLDTLSTTLQDVPSRHRSMRAVFEHSWNLLSAEERAAFSRLAIFRGGCTAEAAMQVTEASNSTLLALVDKSLLSQSSNRLGLTSDASPRFTFLEPIREYALEKLMERGEKDLLQRSHMSYYMTLIESISQGWDTPLSETAIEQLQREYDNLRAALQAAHSLGDVEVGLRLAVSLGRFWRSRGHISEGRGWLEELLSPVANKLGPSTKNIQLQAIEQAAWLATDQHDFKRAEQLFKQAQSLRRELDLPEDDTYLIVNLALQARSVGEYRRATALLEDAVVRHRALRQRGGKGSADIGLSLYTLALVLREQGNFARASVLFEEGIDFFRKSGELEGVAQGILGLSDVARDNGDVPRLREYCEKSHPIFVEFGTQWAIGYTLHNLALADYMEGNFSQAIVLIDASMALFRAIQNDAALAEILIARGRILHAQGELVTASEVLTEALQLAWEMGPGLMLAAALEGLAGVTLDLGKTNRAVRMIRAASDFRLRMGTPLRPVDQPEINEMLKNAQTFLGADSFTAIWESVSDEPLDHILSMLPVPMTSTAVSEIRTNIQDLAIPVPKRNNYWEDAPSVPAFYGREWEINLLNEWIIDAHCRVVSVIGLGGIGKSALAVSFMHRVAEHFEIVIWRSIRDLPDCDTLLESLLQVVAPQALADVNTSLEHRQSFLMEYMRNYRILIVLDNLESALDEGEHAGNFLSGYEGVGRFLRLSAETQHNSCILLTSREKPIDLAAREGNQSLVRTLRLARLDKKACEKLLAEKNVRGDPVQISQLIDAYAGNPLALSIVAQTIVDLFGGEIAPFLEQGEVMYGGVRNLLEEQFIRLSALEQSILIWLAILREPATLDELLTALVTPLPRARLIEALESLYRRSLIERGQKYGSFTLQSVVLEFATSRLITESTNEIREGRLVRLIDHGLELAQAREDVRQTQERLILLPILNALHSAFHQQSLIEEHLLELLSHLRTQADNTQGYGPANLVTLLRLSKGNLRGLDLSELSLRSTYLQGVEMQGTTIAKSVLQGSIFTETFDAITAVAINNTEAYLAAASRDGRILLWEAKTLALRRVWQAHADMVWTLGFNYDGGMLASGSWDGTVKVWNVSNGELLWLQGHSSHVNSVAFSPDGQTLATSGSDATVRLWEVKSGRQLQVLPHPVPVPVVAWSPDGHLLASGDMEGSIYLWEIRKDGPADNVKTFVGHTNWVDGLAFAPRSNLLASASWDGTVKLWDIATRQLQQTLDGHKDRVVRVAWSPDGHLLATASRDHTVWLWDVEEGSYKTILRGHTAGVNGIAFTSDNHRLLSGGEDGTLRVWNVTSGNCIQVVRGHASALYDVDWSPDSTQLISGGTDYLVTIHSLTAEIAPRVMRGHTGVVLGVGWGSNGRLASSEWDNIIHLWNAETGSLLQVLRHPADHGNYFYGLAWSPDGQRLASATYRHGIQIFEPDTHHQHWVGSPFPTWIRRVAWSPDGRQIAGGGDDGTVHIWDSTTGTLLHRLVGSRGRVTDVAWSPDGSQLASGSSDKETGELFIWDTRRGERVYTGKHPGIIYAVAWGPNKSQVVTGGSDGNLRWWDIKRGKSVLIQEAHQGTIQSIKRSPDGKRLVSCGNDGAIMIWDLGNGDHIQTLRRDRPYERLNISKIRGLTEAQKETLRALGAFEKD
ncbi:MAG TPA: NB-ARC domain-containing protein [Anaerolineales bacterium]|nr:NB-ARC domain-containing protein [Anaerolineales bacterium]